MVKVYCDKCKSPIDIAGMDSEDVRVKIEGRGVGYEFDLCAACHRKLITYIAIVDGILAKINDGGLDLTEDEATVLTGVLIRYKGKLIERWLCESV